MTASAHAIVGAALATVIKDPITLTFASLTSHFVMDCIPHWDFGTNWRDRPKFVTGIMAAIDTTIGITLAYLLFWGKASTGLLTIGILFSELPDWMEAPWFMFFHHGTGKATSKEGFWKKIFYSIYKFQSRFHVRAQLPLGGITQILVILLALYISAR